jgi:hypothetical protein
VGEAAIPNLRNDRGEEKYLNRETATAGLTADDIATVWHIPKGTIYRYAHNHRWRRYTHTGRTYYHPEDVIATFDNLTMEAEHR